MKWNKSQFNFSNNKSGICHKRHWFVDTRDRYHCHQRFDLDVLKNFRNFPIHVSEWRHFIELTPIYLYMFLRTYCELFSLLAWWLMAIVTIQFTIYFTLNCFMYRVVCVPVGRCRIPQPKETKTITIWNLKPLFELFSSPWCFSYYEITMIPSAVIFLPLFRL